MENLEMKDLVKKSEELAKANDLWYFVIGAHGAIICGFGVG